MKKQAKSEPSYRITLLITNTPYTVDGETKTRFSAAEGFRIEARHKDKEPIFIVSRGNMLARVQTKHITGWDTEKETARV